MEPVTRTFVRRGERLTLRRESQGSEVVLVAIESGRRRTFPFRSATRLARFQRDMEAFLARTGWVLAEAFEMVRPKSAPSAEHADDQGLRLTFAEEEEVATRR